MTTKHLDPVHVHTNSGIIRLSKIGDAANIGLAFDNDGHWWIIDEDSGAPIRLVPQAGLRLLNMTFAQLHSLLSPFKNTDPFPYHLIALTALTGGSAYWAERALKWIPELENRHIFRSALEEIIDATWASQPLRQQARRLLRTTAVANK